MTYEEKIVDEKTRERLDSLRRPKLIMVGSPTKGPKIVVMGVPKVAKGTLAKVLPTLLLKGSTNIIGPTPSS